MRLQPPPNLPACVSATLTGTLPFPRLRRDLEVKAAGLR
jgi:hypothetical protein